MDGGRFDARIRRMVESRRQILTGTAGLVLAGALSALPPRSAEAAKKKPKRKTKKPATPALKSVYTCAAPDADDLVELNVVSRYAQSFQASRSGTLREIRVLIDKAQSGGDYQVQLVKMDGSVPSKNPFDVLAAATIPDGEVPTGRATLVAKFAATRLEKDTAYAVVVSRIGSEMAIPVPFSGGPCEGTMAAALAGDAFANLDPVRDLTVTVLIA